MYSLGIMMVTFMSLLLYGVKSDDGFTKQLKELGKGLLGSGSKPKCVQCRDYKIDNQLFREKVEEHQTPECADAQTASSSKIQTITCFNAAKDGLVSRCGRLVATMKLSATTPLVKNAEATLNVLWRGCHNFTDDTADSCTFDESVINKKLEEMGTTQFISELGVKTRKTDGRLCVDVGTTVAASGTWWSLCSVLLANFLLS